MSRPVPPTPNRRAFTLVEMLVVITIIGILASFVLGALYVSGESAKRERTISVINKLHAQLMLRYETYATRRVPLNPLRDEVNNSTSNPPADGIPDLPQYDSDQNGVINSSDAYLNVAKLGATESFGQLSDWYGAFGAIPYIAPASGTDPVIARNTALLKLWGLRELMRCELPDQYEDCSFTPQFIEAPPALRFVYLSRINDVLASGGTIAGLAESHQGAECLYLILTTPFGDEGAGSGSFSSRDVADTDSDGMPEFIDGWGRPIDFIRWPAGFASPVQPFFDLDVNGQLQPNNRVDSEDANGNGLLDAGEDKDQNGVLNLDDIDGDGVINDRAEQLHPDPLDGYALERRLDNIASWPLNQQWRGYNLMPLIHSAGADGVFKIYGGVRSPSLVGTTLYIPNYYSYPFAYVPLVEGDSSQNAYQRGSVMNWETDYDGQDLDNVTNHLLQTR